jgi:acyl carrier protein
MMQLLLGLVQESLEGCDPGPTDNYFELGGDSLGAVEVMGELEARCGRELPLEAIFECPDFEALIAKIRGDAETVRQPSDE